MSTERPPLTANEIVDAALEVIDEDGLAKLSMRRLGARLGVDPMAIYHHIDDKQTLLSLVVAQVLAEMPRVDTGRPWSTQVRDWSIAYWKIASRHRDVIGAALTDPIIARGAQRATEPLIETIAKSGLATELVESAAYLVVDFVHGSALSGASADRTDDAQEWFEQGLELIVSGIRSTAIR